MARDGVEIGECESDEFEQLVQAGEVLPTDHYWYEGMEDWGLVDDLIEIEPSTPAAPRWEDEEELSKRPSADDPEVRPSHPVDTSGEGSQPAPIFRNRRTIAAAIGGGALVVAAFVLYLVVSLWTARPDTPLPTAPATTNLERTDRDLRARATSELIAKLNKLPVAATPPSYTFYDSLSITIPDPPAALTVTVRGTENAVNSETHEAISRTDFVVTADFREDRWFFKYYHASGNDLVHGTTTEIERDDQYPIPPAIVSLLGFQVKSD